MTAVKGTVDIRHKPLRGNVFGAMSFERGKDPWHPEAFDEAHQRIFSMRSKAERRAEGWFALDFCGNVLAFIPDGAHCMVEEA